jgi:hypothetical protein
MMVVGSPGEARRDAEAFKIQILENNITGMSLNNAFWLRISGHSYHAYVVV